MRTIKFQLVFDTAIGKYVTKQSYTIEDFLNFRYGLDCLLEKETENFTMHDHDAFFYYEPKLIAKRQFTGLLDKNGVEVFEGDVVAIDEPQVKFKVVFEDGAFIFKGKYTFFPLHEAEFFEVIGNIYEHPHLPEENHD